MTAKPTKTYGPAEVCYAANIPRATFHSWVSRGLLHLGRGPGMGKARQFTLIQAIRIATIARLNRLGIAVSTAADCCQGIHEDLLGMPCVLILLEPSQKNRRSSSEMQPPEIYAVEIKHLTDTLRRFGTRNTIPKAFSVIDISMINLEMTTILDDPETFARANKHTDFKMKFNDDTPVVTYRSHQNTFYPLDTIGFAADDKANTAPKGNVRNQ